MKILLDECVTKKLKPFLSGHSVFTVTEMKWNGLRNGKLMISAIEKQFDLLLTIDKNLLFQQNAGKYEIIVIVFDAHSSKIDALKEFIQEFNRQSSGFRKRNGYILSI